MRLQKFMAEAGVGSRRKCEEIIREGRVCVNGEKAVIGVSVQEGDKVTLDGKPLQAQRNVVVVFYKPRGVVCSNRDPQGRPSVGDYFSKFPFRLFHVGRLDLNSEGLLLMTNDGEFAYRMTHPKFEVEKTYYVVCDGTLTEQEANMLRNGVVLEDGLTAPAKVDFIRPTSTGHTSFLITIHEGRNRQVRRMLEAVGHRTLRLRREKIGTVHIGTMKPGEWRYLTQEEIRKIAGI